MVETHGGGRHYVPDDADTKAKGVNATQPLFRSLEDCNDLIALVAVPEVGVAPLSFKRANLKRVLGVLDEKQVFSDSSQLAALLREGTVTQDDVEELKLYDPLIPGDESANQTPTSETLAALAEAMLVDSDPVSNIPAAYTYFGQFLAHDMSHMALETTRQWKFWTNKNAYHALQFDSLFGTVEKPGDPSSDWVTNAGSTLGQASYYPDGVTQFYDLPRRGTAGVPCCIDPRADTNLGLAQMHVLLVRFNQALASKLNLNDDAARLTTKKNLQAVVLTDYLRRLVPEKIYKQVMYHNRRLVAPEGAEGFLIPLEFAAAIFRFGHSMIRGVYQHWALPVPPFCFSPNLEKADLGTLLDNTSRSRGLTLEGRVKASWCTQWRQMIGSEANYPDKQIWARAISASLASSLGHVGLSNFPDVEKQLAPDATDFNLALHTLDRGQKFKLPSGQALAKKADLGSTLDIAAFLKTRPDRFSCFSPEDEFHHHTPLWFYVLAEAEHQGDGKLGPLGAMIVMETFHAALESDPTGILKINPDKSSRIEFDHTTASDGCTAPYFSLGDVVRTVYS